MDVLLGPTFSIGVSSAPEYAGDRNGVSPSLEEHGSASSCLSLKEEEKGGIGKIESGFRLFGRGKDLDEDDSDASSSIGAPDDESEEDDGDYSKSDRVDEEVQSKLNRGLDSLGSLEDSLPTKKGLSNHFTGKSKSFTNLSDACSAKDLEKPENPFNKRRRLLMAAKLSRKSSFYTWHNPKSMPLLAVQEDDEEEDLRPSSSQRVNPGEDEDEEEEEEEEEEAVSNLLQRRLKNMKSFSCFSLSEMDNHHLHQL